MIIDLVLNDRIENRDIPFEPATPVIRGDAVEHRYIRQFADMVSVVAGDVGIAFARPVAVEQRILNFQTGSTIRHENRAALTAALIVQQP